ncbi:MAG: hypothetical protein Q4G68_12675 [Planctomycetia bacterium]|nr:hypothetical protein [Planctomycetia bacterium]
MNRRFLNAWVFALAVCVTILPFRTVQAEESDPPRLPRKDCFFGVHFDFHAEMKDKNIGQNTTPEMLNALIDITHPDYFETDTKGHPGVSSYPTRVGNHGGSFVGDPLKVWREITAKRGVSLYGHHSGIWDRRAYELHNDWSALAADGSQIGEKMSTLGPYSDSLLIPQLTELANDYGLDGGWVDGDCWGVVRDWSPAAKELFTKETGIDAIPTNKDDPNWHAWSNFHRELFRRYVKHYITTVKAANPDFEFCSNWAFSIHMPEAPFEGVDFISGDICGYNCVNVCRYNSRLFMTQEVPWDLMSWSFCDWSLGDPDQPEIRKTAIQLMREAACVIAQGGGYQAVFSQKPAGRPPVRDGSVDIEKVRLFGEVAKFCRERQEVCFKAKGIPQIALLLSTEGTYRRWDQRGQALFWWDRWQDGILDCLVEDRQAVSILVTQRLMEHMDEYPLVVVFQWDYVEPELVEQLGKYVEKGGRLYLVGPAMPKLFDAVLKSASAVRNGTAPEGRSLQYYTLGKGTIAMTPQENPPSEFVNATVHELFPDPIVKIDGTPQVDLSLMRTVKGEMAIHLVNTSGPHATAGVIETVDPVGPVALTVRLPKKPAAVRLEPGHREIDWQYANGQMALTVDTVPIHEIIVVTEAE